LAVYRSLDLETRASVDAHLRECPACAARLAGYERVDQSLRALPAVRLPARLQRPWPGQWPASQVASRARRPRGGYGLAAGRILLPASLIAGLVAGVWLLLASLSGGENGVIATPTLTLTPTATAMVRLDEAGEAAVHVDPGAIPSPQAALYTAPRPTLIAAPAEVSGAFNAP
jgi:anti-sigma factor RsiW